MITNILSYWKKNINSIIVTTFVFLLFFMPHLLNSHIGIDTFTLINYPDSKGNWMEIGRQGAALIRSIVYSNKYSIFFTSGISFFIYLLALISFCYLFEYIAEVPSWESCLFFLLFMIHPIWVEQLYFTMQMLEISVGVLIIPISLYCSYSGKKLSAIILMILSFSIYQTFVIIYIAGNIMCFLLLYIQDERKNAIRKNNFYFGLAQKQVVYFIVAFGVNTIITNIFFSKGNYFINSWKSDSVYNCVQNIFSHIYQIIVGNGIFYNRSYLVSLVLASVGVLNFLIKVTRKEKWCFIFALIGLEIMPFALTIYGGNIPVFRAQFILPFVSSCNYLLAYTLGDSVFKHFDLNRIICLVSGCVLLTQYYGTSLLQYSMGVTYEEDERRAFAIENAILKETNGVNKPVAFIGVWEERKNNAFVYGELSSASLFRYAAEWAGPRYSQSTIWSTEYMKSLGIYMNAATDQEIQEARIYAQTMPVWPIDGCVQDKGDYVIVKLSPDTYFSDDLMFPSGLQVLGKDRPNFNERVKGCIDELHIDDEYITIKGWVIMMNQDTLYTIPGVYLWNEVDNKLYSLSCGAKNRPDLENAFPNGIYYRYGGIYAKAPLKDLPHNISNLKVIMSITNNFNTAFFDTGLYVSDLCD